MARLRLPMGRLHPDTPFEGEVVCLTSPRGLEFAVVEGSPQEIAGRDAAQPDALWLSVLLEGRATLTTADAGWTLRPGDIVHGRTGTPATLRFETAFRQLYVKAPRLALGHRLAQPLSPEVGRLAGDRGVSAVFSALLRATAERLEELTSEDLRPVEIAVTEFLIAALIDEGGAVARGGAAGARAARLHRVCQLIEGRLGDPELTLADIALEDGTSVRHLQALFAGGGLNFTTYVRNRRLERCRADLASPLWAQRSISDICFRWGFSASSHFSRAFRARYGVSPRAFRQSTLEV